MDFRLLRTFVAAYEEGSFSRAAERLNATQPGVSVQIAQLESDLDQRLFDRQARQVLPTTAGKKLYSHASRILFDLATAEQAVRALSGVVKGVLAIGIPPTFSNVALGPALAEFVETYSEVEVRVLEAYSDTLLALVESGKLDFAIIARIPQHPGIRYRSFYSSRFVLVSGEKLDLPLDVPVALDREPHFKFAIPSVMRHGLIRLLEEALHSGRIIPSRIIEIDGLVGIQQFVMRTDWAALLPEIAVRFNTDGMKLRVNPIAGEDLKIDYFIASASTRPISQAGELFIEQLRLALEPSQVSKNMP